MLGTRALRGLRQAILPRARSLCTGASAHSASDPVLFEVDNVGIARVTLNNPKRRNPLSKEVLVALHGAVHQVVGSLGSADRVRAVVLQSTGPVFCSGHDFKEFVLREDGLGKEEHREILAMCTDLNVRLQRECPPTIAAVDGLATAAGCQLVASCDLIFATRTSSFCVPGSRNGGFCHTPGVALANKVHPRKALEMLLLAEDMTAADAERFGLVNRLAEDADELSAMVEQAAQKLAATSAHNTLLGKQGFYSHIEKTDLDGKYATASRYMLDMFASEDQQEGIDAFFGKRKPVWRDA